jgi:hypothetical protein
MRRKKNQVREPIQVYVDRDDRALLDEVATRTGLARAEVLRRGLRAVATQLLGATRPGSSLEVLTGALGDDPDLPQDLAARHDEYLVGILPKPKTGRGRPRGR